MLVEIAAIAKAIGDNVLVDSKRKYSDLVYELSIELLKEKEKGYNSNDVRIMFLEKELKIAMEAMKNEIISFVSKRD